MFKNDTISMRNVGLIGITIPELTLSIRNLVSLISCRAELTHLYLNGG